VQFFGVSDDAALARWEVFYHGNQDDEGGEADGEGEDNDDANLDASLDWELPPEDAQTGEAEEAAAAEEEEEAAADADAMPTRATGSHRASHASAGATPTHATQLPSVVSLVRGALRSKASSMKSRRSHGSVADPSNPFQVADLDEVGPA
jgi:hypothetical protein